MTAAAWCDGGQVDCETLPVELDAFGLPPRFVALPTLALDEQDETAWWGRIRYARAPLLGVIRKGEPWRYFHCPPGRSGGGLVVPA